MALSSIKVTAGTYDRRVAIETSSQTQTTSGEPVLTWVTHVSAWASIRPISGLERIDADQTTASATHRVEMRYQAGVTEKMRVAFDGRIFGIESILNVQEANKVLILKCRELKS